MDPTVAVALITAIGGVIVAVIVYMGQRNSKKLDNIQINVDGTLTRALDEIEALKLAIQRLGGKEAPPPRDRSGGQS